MLNIKQIGKNPDFPDKAEVWKYGEDIPDWLSDRAKVSSISNGNPVLKEEHTKTGEICLFDSTGLEYLIKLKSKDSYILYSKTHPLLSLTPKQLKLLYKIY